MRENDYWSVSGKENPLNFSALFFFRMSFMLKYTTLYTLRVCLDVFPFFSVAIFSKTFYIYISVFSQWRWVVSFFVGGRF